MFVQQYVLGLQVPVQNEFVVHMVEGQQNLNEEVQDGVFIQQGVASFLYVVS